MFAGKTQELIRRLRLAAIARQKVQVFKHDSDARYSKDDVVSHDQIKIPSIPISTPSDLLKHLHPTTRVVGIDEVHFFDASIVTMCQKLADEGRRVIVAGLDQDSRGEPFGPMPHLMAVAEYVSKPLAVCVVCGSPANRTQRMIEDTGQVDVGHSDKYEARCRHCFEGTDESGHFFNFPQSIGKKNVKNEKVNA
ncbi:thymidine kinase [Candidatus Peribacteria bacterium RIFCSPHIGHO2_01_FULL_51_9]|nr:MAG: thymidine kinase [Candidatus Peribacteria bacterium RIFCSPHIGHO2_01_FULL_51_9]